MLFFTNVLNLPLIDTFKNIRNTLCDVKTVFINVDMDRLQTEAEAVPKNSLIQFPSLTSLMKELSNSAYDDEFLQFLYSKINTLRSQFPVLYFQAYIHINETKKNVLSYRLCHNISMIIIIRLLAWDINKMNAISLSFIPPVASRTSDTTNRIKLYDDQLQQQVIYRPVIKSY
jgi:hypothetical protein